MRYPQSDRVLMKRCSRSSQASQYTGEGCRRDPCHGGAFVVRHSWDSFLEKARDKLSLGNLPSAPSQRTARSHSSRGGLDLIRAITIRAPHSDRSSHRCSRVGCRMRKSCSIFWCKGGGHRLRRGIELWRRQTDRKIHVWLKITTFSDLHWEVYREAPGVHLRSAQRR